MVSEYFNQMVIKLKFKITSFPIQLLDKSSFKSPTFEHKSLKIRDPHMSSILLSFRSSSCKELFDFNAYPK